MTLFKIRSHSAFLGVRTSTYLVAVEKHLKDINAWIPIAQCDYSGMRPKHEYKRNNHCDVLKMYKPPVQTLDHLDGILKTVVSLLNANRLYEMQCTFTKQIFGWWLFFPLQIALSTVLKMNDFFLFRELSSGFKLEFHSPMLIIQKHPHLRSSLPINLAMGAVTITSRKDLFYMK